MNSAELLQRARQQRVALRKKNAAQQQTSTTIRPNVASTLKWLQLGPAPLADPDYGPVSGRATAVAVDQTDTTGNTVYVGGAYGGLWRSTNAASADPLNVVWTQLLDSAPTLAVGAVAVKPDNGKVILVGTGTPGNATDSYYGVGMLRSEDGGGTWTQVNDAAPASGSTRVSFKGAGFSKIAFSTDNANTVVGAASLAYRSAGLTSGWGLFYSTDAGKTWKAATLSDGATQPLGGTGVSTVVYNAADKKFYAAISYHGLYSSTDGATWTRLANQPMGAAMDTTNCPAAGDVNCPIYRAELAVRAGTVNELYTWIVNQAGADKGLFVSKDSGATWTALNQTGMTSCGDTTGCGATAALANLALVAVPNGDGTDVYAGAANIFKCSITADNPTCGAAPFINLTHVFGCSPKASPAHVHPGQHGVAFSNTNPKLVYFANDGGIYRTLDGPGLNGGVCTDTNAFGNLNGTMGSMAQLVSFSQPAADDAVLLAGTPTNGSISTNTSTNVNRGDNGLGWGVYSAGAGVLNAAGNTAINPADANEWFVSAPDLDTTYRQAVSISRCANGVSCKDAFTKVIDPSTYGDDSTGFPAPFILDPLATDQMILGTCRVWRGASNPTAAWAGALSPNFRTGDATKCSFGTDRMITAVAAGGPKVDGVGSPVIYAGDEGGHIYVTSNANATPAAWTSVPADFTATPTWGSFPISSIAVDTTDATGATAYMTVQGFNGTGGHVFKTTDKGATWTKISGDPSNGGVPDAPANAIAIDAGDANVLYVGTDVGVYTTSDNGAHWAEYGPTSGAGVLPNVPVTKLEAINAETIHKLRASTYGRGMWEIALASYNDFMQSVTPAETKVSLGGTTTFTATYTALGAFKGDIAVTCTTPDGSALPDGVTCTPSPATVTTGTTSVITVNTDATKVTSAGTLDLVIVGASGTLEAKKNPVSLNLTDFAVVVPKNGDQEQNTATVNAGETATYPITVTTTSNHADGVALTCTGTLPDKTTCSFVPTTIVAGATATLSLKTTAATTAQLSAPMPFGQKPLFAIWFGLPGIVVAGAGISGRRRKLMAMAVVLIIAATIGFVACGGGSSSSGPTTTPGTPAGTYTVTVQGATGTLTHTTTVTLVVK